MKERQTNVTIKQAADAPIEVEVLAQAIISIDAAAHKLLSSGLTEEAIVILLHDLLPSKGGGSYGNQKPGKVAVREVLRGLRQLRKRYCTK